MRLRLGRRATGPAAAHNSRFGPSRGPTITSAQRDAIHRQIIDRLSTAGDLSMLVEQQDREAARCLAREVADDLQLVLDGLGLGETTTRRRCRAEFSARAITAHLLQAPRASRRRARGELTKAERSTSPLRARPDRHRDLRPSARRRRRRDGGVTRVDSELADRGAPSRVGVVARPRVARAPAGIAVPPQAGALQLDAKPFT